MKSRPQRKPGRFNALLGWELLRVSRRTGALAISRFIFGASLLGVMWLLWTAEFAASKGLRGDAAAIAKELARFAEAFGLTFFVVQLAIVLLLTPIFVAGSVFEERDTRSGEVLLTTDLTRKEIFYGKYLARVVQVLMVVMAGVPVLALTILWGGVSIEFIVTGYVVTIACVFSAGAIAVSVAGGSETFREAIVKAYGYVIVFDGLVFPASPFLVIRWASGENFGGALCFGVLFLTVQIIVTLTSLGYGLRWLRLAMLRQRKRITDELAEKMATRHPPVADENPLVWKEKYVSGQTKYVSDAILMACAIVGTMIVLGVLLTQALPGGWLLRIVAPIALLASAVLLGIGTASGVAIERQKNTLIDLFMLPGGRNEVLRAKAYGAIWRARFPILLLFGLLPFGFVNGTPLLAIPLVALAALAFLAFSAAFGAWLSVRCRSALSANATWIGTIGLGLIGTYLLVDASANWDRAGGAPVRRPPTWGSVVNPALAWIDLACEPDDPQPDYGGYQVRKFQLLPPNNSRLPGALGGVLLYGCGAIVLWRLARRRFEREGREE